MTMASNGIVKGLNVFKDKFVSMAEIRYLKAVEPFPFLSRREKTRCKHFATD